MAGAFKALAAKGSLGLGLVLETIFSDWRQHDHAQVAVMAATVEELLGRAVAAASDEEARCSRELMTRTALAALRPHGGGGVGVAGRVGGPAQSREPLRRGA
ncbi:MAG: hypothetical protein V1750_08180 [Acidobacteriota bacterium]